MSHAQSYLEDLRQRLHKRFLVLEETFENEFPPTQEARNACQEILFQVARSLPPGTRLPWPHIASLGGGDLECYWSQGDRRLFLSVSPSGGTRLQRILSGTVRVESLEVIESPGWDKLADSILWLNSADAASAQAGASDGSG
jgi:hypothetical protein